MKYGIALLFAFFLMCQPVAAQNAVTQKPVCFQIQNRSPYKTYGTIVTDTYTEKSGAKARHRANFSLESGHFGEFCSTGPFYPGQKLDIQLRSLFPLFECRTALTKPLVIQGRRDSEGRYKTWIDCIQ